MPQETKARPSDAEEGETAPGVQHENLEGWVPPLASEQELAAALEKAFDYRGDVTITRKDGTRVEGYVFDRRVEGEGLAQCRVRLFPKDGGAKASGCSRPQAAAGPVKSPSASTAPSPTAPTEASEKDPAGGAAGGAGKFERPDLGVRLEWPEGWAQHKSADFVLLLRPAAKGRGDEASAPSLSLDVPDLPPHIPGMIPIGSVRNGYLDDLRKSVG